MRTFKYAFQDQSNVVRIGNLLDDMWQVHVYFHEWQRHRYKNGLPYANYYAMDAHFKDLKRTTHPHWRMLPSQAVQQELMRIDEAYQRFFDKLSGRPHIKQRHKFKSITYPGTAGWKIEDNRITLSFRKWNPKTRKWQFDKVPFTFFKHRKWIGDISTITIKRDACGDYWLCITTNATDIEVLPITGESVGADFGMKDAFLTLNTGEKIQSPQFLKQSLKQLRKLNKSLSRKVKGSGNYWSDVLALVRLYRKISNQRLDWQWKLATDLCRRFDIIVTETLNLEGMKRLWGRKVSDLSFGQFVEILKYKCSKHNRAFHQVGQWTATSKPCSDCGYHNENLTLNDRQWRCPECGSDHDRDVNAAINILRAGLAASVEQT